MHWMYAYLNYFAGRISEILLYIKYISSNIVIHVVPYLSVYIYNIHMY